VVLEESDLPRKTGADDEFEPESLAKQRVAEVRNAKRWQEMNSADETLLGKLTVQYLSSDPEKFSPPPVWGPDDTFEPPEWLSCRQWN
jgi:hypothetical protein